eukprot:TRINITY_DN11304_c0_g2_i1.p1 TRINITY_DN11304_c0_g2~~TRINITY_DN11304_c0_g2_i1.p1  ORF type:complete len:501 (+),score=82.96 TRINITY_DN11304_c0_g2_i1:2-1504(+)
MSIAAITLLLVLLAFVLRKSFSSRLPHIPGPSYTLPYIGNTIEVFSVENDFLLKCAEKFGPVMKFRTILGESVLVSSPDLVKQVLQTDQHLYGKRIFIYGLIEEVIGEGLVTIADHDIHKSLRGTINEAFTYSNLKLYFPIFNLMGAQLVREWRKAADEGKIVDVAQDFGTCTLDIIGRIAFGVDLQGFTTEKSNNQHAPNNGILSSAVQTLQLNLNTSPLELVPGIRHVLPNVLRRKGATELMSQELAKIVNVKKTLNNANNDARVEDKTQQDFLDILLRLRDENGSELSLESLINQSKTFLLAGHETTAVALSWTFYLLATHPEVQNRLWDEIQTHLSSHPDALDEGFPVEAVDSMKYLNKVTKESLRIRPPIPAIMRRAEHDTTLGDYHIPKDTVITVGIYVMHHHPDLWTDPERFDPDRWDALDSQKSMGTYIPFVMGDRSCIGNRFALLEIKAIVAHILANFSVALAPDHPPVGRTYNMVTVHPSPHVKLALKQR